MRVSDKELRLLSELVYLDLDQYMGIGGPVSKLKNEEATNLLLERLKKNKSSLKRDDVKSILSGWELVYSLQHILKMTSQDVNNPLLDAFVFKSLHNNQLVVAFRGSNRDDEMQWEEDMKVNLALIFTKLMGESEYAQIDQACSFVTLILKMEKFPLCKNCNNDHRIPTEGPYKEKVCDYSNYIYLTGHSKGGGITQQVVYILETLYKLKVSGVTFAATPTEGMSIIIDELKAKSVLYPEYDLKLSSCVNYLIKRDRVLIGLRLHRMRKLLPQFNEERKRQNDIGNKKRVPIYKLIKILRVWKAEYIGQKHLISPRRPFSFVNPTIRIKKHNLSFFDGHFDNDGNIKSEK